MNGTNGDQTREGEGVREDREDPPMSEESIRKALDAVRTRVARSERELAELGRVIAAAREEERLLKRLLALRRGEVPGDMAEGKAAQAQHPERLEARDDNKHPAVQAVLQELEVAGRPLHISELMRLLREAKVAIPGSGTQANLITHLRRDDRLVRPSRGMYGLAAWGLSSMPAPRRARRRRRRMRSTASQPGRTQA